MPVAVILSKHAETADPRILVPLPARAAFSVVSLLTMAEVGDGSLVTVG